MKKKLTAFLFALCFAVIGLFACAPVDETSKYSVTLDYTASQGTVTLDPVRDSYEAGEQITVTVTPNEGYTVETFTVNGENAALTDSVYRFEIEKDTVVKVVFKSTQTAADTFEVSTEYDAQRGSITLEPASEGGKYEAGTSVTATVTALEGFELETFTVNGRSAELTENRYTFEVNADTALKATFKEVGAEVTYYNVSASCDETKGSVSIEPAPADGKIAAGTSVTVTVTPDEHYEIGTFTVNGRPAEISDGKYVFTVNGDAEIAATFIGKAYEITLEYDDELGSVALSGGEGGVYRYGDEITVTVTPAQTAAISSVTINGAEAQLEQNVCSFTLEGETTVAVQFYSTAFTQEMLDSLKGKILFDGSYLYQYTDLADDAFDYNETMIVKTLFEEGMVWIRESWNGETQYDYVIVDHNGLAAQVAHTAQNGIEYYDSQDSIEPYLNPFEWTDITTSSFECVSEGLYRLTINASRLKEVAAAITGYNETIEEFYLTVENGAVTGITIKTGEVSVYDHYDRENPIGTYISDYTFTVTEHGTATIPEEYYKPYAGTEAHAELKSALEAADAATSYTIHRSDYFADDGSTNTYDVYVTESAIYLDHSKNPDDPYDFDDRHGYALLDGDVYPFEYDQAANSFEFDEGLGADALSSLRALFNCFAPELLESKGDGVFELRLVDTLLAGEIATNFGNGEDEKSEYEYATSFKITVKDGKIESIEITEDIWGSVLVVTLTFEKFNETTLPIEIKKDVPPTPGTEIPEAWYGTFKGEDDGVAYVVEISAESIAITIDGAPATVEIVSYDDYEGFTLTLNGEEYYLMNTSGEEPIDSIALMSEDYFSVMVTLDREGGVPTPGVKIPEAWYGTFKGNDDHGNEVVLKIDENGMTLTIGGEPADLKVLSFDGSYTFEITIDGAEYSLEDSTMYGSGVDNLTISDDTYSTIYLNRTEEEEPTPGVEIPAEWFGVYKGTKSDVEYVLTIDGNGMTLTVGGEPREVEVLSYNGRNTFGLSIGGVDYTLENYGDGLLALYPGSDYRSTVYLTLSEDIPGVDIPEAWYGKFKGQDDFGSEYVLTIDENGMTLTIGGEPADIKVISFDGFNSFEVTIDGDEWELSTFSDANIDSVMLSQGFMTMIYLDRDSGDAPQPSGIPEKFYGTFKGSNRAEQDVYVVIDANGVSMKIGDGALTPGSDVSYESSYSEIYFTVGGVEYSIGDASYDDPITTIMVCDINGYTIYDTFTRTTDPIPSDPISIPESWNGRFEGTAGDGTAYVVEIEDGHVTVTIGGAAPIEAEITDYNDIDGYTLNLNGSEYYLRAVGSGETVDVLQIKDDDGQWGWDEIELTRKEKPATPTFTEDWIGTYTYTKSMFADGHDFVLTIRADGFTLKVDSGDPEEITNYEFNSVNISFTHNGNDVLIYKYTGKNLRIEYGSDSAVTLYKQATVVKYTVTVQQEGGTVTVDPQQADYDENTAITVTVEAPEGMKVKSFKVNGQETALEENVYRFNITQNTTIEIEYEQDAPADVFPQEWIGFYKGSSFLSGSFEIEIRADGFTFKKGSKAAEEITEFHFDGEELTFSYDGMSATVTRYADTGNLKLAYDGTTTLTKQATVNKYTVTVQQEGGTVTLDPQQAQYDENTSITVTVEAPARKQVKSFKVNGTEQDLTQNKYTFNITQTTTIEIEYEDIPLGETFPVTIETEHGLVELITVSPVGNNEYEKGSDVAFYVEPDFGMKVVAVKVNGAAQELTSGRYTFKIEAATVISVEYAEDEESSFECYADFYGKWMGEGSTADSGVSYTVVINEHTITVFANGTYQRVAHATYQQGNVTGQWGTIQFNLNGEPVTIKNSNVKQIRMSDVNNYGTHVSAILNYVEDGEELPDEDDGGKIPAKWRGTYYTQSATRGDITLVLEKDTLSLTVSYDGSYTGEFTYEDNKFTFEWNSRPITISIATSEASGLVKSITLKYGSSETYTLVRHEEGDAEPDPDPNPDKDWPTDRLPAEWAGSWDGSYAHEDTGETDYYTLVVNADGSVTLNEFECTNITGKTDPSVGMLYTFECDGVTYTLWQSDEHLALMPDGYISAIPLSRP